jgi:hypothetical protein
MVYTSGSCVTDTTADGRPLRKGSGIAAQDEITTGGQKMVATQYDRPGVYVGYDNEHRPVCCIIETDDEGGHRVTTVTQRDLLKTGGNYRPAQANQLMARFEQVDSVEAPYELVTVAGLTTEVQGDGRIHVRDHVQATDFTGDAAAATLDVARGEITHLQATLLGE